MKKNLLLCLILALTSIGCCFAKGKMTKEEKAQAATEIASMLENKQWIFLPKDVTFSGGSRIDKLQSPDNFFVMQGDSLDMQVNLARGIMHNPSASSSSTYFGFFNSKMNVYKSEVTTSKDNNVVKVMMEGNLESKSSNHVGRAMIDVRVNIAEGLTYVQFRDKTREATFIGTIGEYTNLLNE